MNTKKTIYSFSNIEFEILQARLSLSMSMNDFQLKKFQEYEKLCAELQSQKESEFIKFVINEFKQKQ